MYARRTADRTVTLGVSGSLWKDALIMHDRETGSLWTQVTGEAVRGPMEGKRLEHVPSVVTTWSRWREEHPDTLALVRDPDLGESEDYRDYHADPDTMGIFGTRNPDGRLPGKTRVLGVAPGVVGDHGAVAYLRDRAGVRNDLIGGVPIVVVVEGAGGAARIFRRAVDGREHLFDPRPDGEGLYRDEGTGSLWDLVRGEAVEGPLAGTSLEPVPSVPAYWFAWAAFHPASEVRPADELPGRGDRSRD